MKKYCVGIDLGGTFIKFITLDAQRRAGTSLQLPTPQGADAVIEQMASGARQVMQAGGVAPGDVVGVGIGAPGPLDLANGIVLAMPNLPGFRNIKIRDRIAKALDLPAVLENDANAAGYGEYLCGAGGAGGDMVLLTLGTGVGGGIVIDGRVLHGHHGIGAELGHMIVVPGGEPCGCGQVGCLERYCSATYIARHATMLMDQGRPSSLKAIYDRSGAVDARDINEAQKAGDALASEVWARGVYHLALGCVNIARIFDPQRIVLAGGMTRAGEDLVIPLRQEFARLHWKLTEPKTELVIAQLGTDAGVIGAAGVAWAAFGA